MIVDERMVTYIHSLETPENPLLEEIEKRGTGYLCADHPERDARAF